MIALATFVVLRETAPNVTLGYQNTLRTPTSFLEERDVETGFSQSVTVLGAPLFAMRSKYQAIEVFESHHFGKILRLDGVMQLTERDADSYNEMMAHVALFQHANPVRVLVIGGGDGYVVNEVLKHPSVQHVDHVELDVDVITTCQKFFPWGHVWDDPRVRLHIRDGATFVQEAPAGSYDVIIQDSSDPWSWDENGNTKVLPSSVLYSADHYRSIYRVLAEGGVLSFQVCTIYGIHVPLSTVSRLFSCIALLTHNIIILLLYSLVTTGRDLSFSHGSRRRRQMAPTSTAGGLSACTLRVDYDCDLSHGPNRLHDVREKGQQQL